MRHVSSLPIRGASGRHTAVTSQWSRRPVLPDAPRHLDRSSHARYAYQGIWSHGLRHGRGLERDAEGRRRYVRACGRTTTTNRTVVRMPLWVRRRDTFCRCPMNGTVCVVPRGVSREPVGSSSYVRSLHGEPAAHDVDAMPVVAKTPNPAASRQKTHSSIEFRF